MELGFSFNFRVMIFFYFEIFGYNLVMLIHRVYARFLMIFGKKILFLPLSINL